MLAIVFRAAWKLVFFAAHGCAVNLQPCLIPNGAERRAEQVCSREAYARGELVAVPVSRPGPIAWNARPRSDRRFDVERIRYISVRVFLRRGFGRALCREHCRHGFAGGLYAGLKALDWID